MDLVTFMNHSSILLKKIWKNHEKTSPLQRPKPFIKVFPFLYRNFEQIKVLPMRNNPNRPQKIDFFFESAQKSTKIIVINAYIFDKRRDGASIKPLHLVLTIQNTLFTIFFLF
jgi:hypothetical protein